MSLTILEITSQAKALVETKKSLEHFKTMAKAILLDVAEHCASPSTLKRKLKKIKDALKDEFETVSNEYKTSYKDHANFCLISYLQEYQAIALENNNPDLRASDYPEIMRRVLEITDKQPVETPVEAVEAVEAVEGAKPPQAAVKATKLPQATAEVAKPLQATVEAVDQPDEVPPKLDATKLIQQATQLLSSDNWCDLAIAIALLTGRRQVEVTADMEFLAHDLYTLVISSPVKKKSDGSYYEIPCLTKSDDIEQAYEKLKRLADFPNFKIHKNLGNNIAARRAFNNCYKKQLLDRYNETFRPLLNIRASVDYGNPFKELRSVYTSILREAKKESYKPYSPKHDASIMTFLKGCMTHKSESATVKYGNWDVENVPDYLIEITTKTYGEPLKIERKTGMVLVQLDLTTLETLLRENDKAYKLFNEQYIDKLGDPVALSKALVNLFEEAVREPEKKNHLLAMISPSTRRGDVTTARIASIVSAMLRNNDTSDLKVFITESQVRSAYHHIYGETVNFNLVKNYIESLGSTVDDHNQYKGLDTNVNLRLRGVKIREIYENVRQLITQDEL